MSIEKSRRKRKKLRKRCVEGGAPSAVLHSRDLRARVVDGLLAQRRALEEGVAHAHLAARQVILRGGRHSTQKLKAILANPTIRRFLIHDFAL